MGGLDKAVHWLALGLCGWYAALRCYRLGLGFVSLD